MSAHDPLITITSDFGTADSYVAQMKGVILGVNSRTRLIDVTHEIPPQAVFRAALMLPELLQTFPAGTYHLVVVDPGVGSARRILAAELDGHYFIAPDNGLLDPLLQQATHSRVYELTNSRFWRNEISTTFHGRDIMAPAIAHWSRGATLDEMGEPLSGSPISLPLPEPTMTESEVVGTILYVDHFGNMVSNIRREHVKQWEGSDVDPIIRLESEGSLRFIDSGISETYADSLPGQGLILWGSHGFLEVALNGGNAAAKFKSQAGETLTIY
ncbi:Adenosyl-chloride synthase [Polystyrenella longa]|uniref:Adenosyl-chloride synthase n=1 Tax=Polystyrenella longa TaxID=2528007 RepID=A0A518CHE2_9PLAN|nr:SAM-dependent chlorinase/fluorinase [Polystyrenella longa]QDU78646.1 Adenosyl-chloride synthase [Polystyrenella longa]